MTLHTVGPATMAEDERTIGRAYQIWHGPAYAIVPFGIAAYVPDTRWLIAAGIAAGLMLLHEIGGRLHDLCIRLRRTNIILVDRFSN